jgi:hypothetical protein
MIKENSKIQYDKTIVIHVEKEMWKSLRSISLDKETTMSDLIRLSIKNIINKYEKNR